MEKERKEMNLTPKEEIELERLLKKRGCVGCGRTDGAAHF